jgi:hypothetical protein
MSAAAADLVQRLPESVQPHDGGDRAQPRPRGPVKLLTSGSSLLSATKSISLCSDTFKRAGRGWIGSAARARG